MTAKGRPKTPLLKPVLRDDRVATARDEHGKRLTIQFAPDITDDQKQRLVDAIDAGGYEITLDDERRRAIVTRGDR